MHNVSFSSLAFLATFYRIDELKCLDIMHSSKSLLALNAIAWKKHDNSSISNEMRTNWKFGYLKSCKQHQKNHFEIQLICRSVHFSSNHTFLKFFKDKKYNSFERRVIIVQCEKSFGIFSKQLSYPGLQAKIQKHEAFEAEVHAHSNAIAQLDKTGTDMIQHHHFASDIIKVSGSSTYE